MAKKEKDKMPDDFDMLKAIRAEKIYKSNIGRRDKSARTYLNENCIDAGKNIVNQVFLGQMIMFDYMTPKTREELEYYDAMPCTIFLGVTKTKEGPRVVGFNIHYYPPKMRYQIINQLFTLFKDSYKNAWGVPLKEDIQGFNYEDFLKVLKKAKLEFGIRMYIPNLMRNMKIVPFKYWTKAVFTEGLFKKATRMAIMGYWRQLKEKNYF